MQCPDQKNCSCTYAGCPRHGNCRQCVAHHKNKGQFTACFFSEEAERTYDRSLTMLLKDRGL